jgi:hypothetical protein
MASGPGPVDALTASATQLFVSIFGQDTYDRLRAEHNVSGVRRVIEFHQAQVQCNNILTGDLAFVEGVTKCWICGGIIHGENNRVCEHVLPVSQARFFWFLYEKDLEIKLRGDRAAYNQMLQLEYGWAHQAPCNSMKKDIVFLRRQQPNKVWSPIMVDIPALENFLTALAHEREEDVATFVRDRKAIIIRERLQPIVDRINQAPALQYLAGLARYLDPRTYSEKFRQILFPKPGQIVEPEPEELEPVKFDEIMKLAELTYNTIVEEFEKIFEQAPEYDTSEYLSPQFVYFSVYLPYVEMLYFLQDDALAQEAAAEIYVLSVLNGMQKDLDGRIDRALSVRITAYYKDTRKSLLDTLRSIRAPPSQTLQAIINSVDKNTYIIPEDASAMNILDSMLEQRYEHTTKRARVRDLFGGKKTKRTIRR